MQVRLLGGVGAEREATGPVEVGPAKCQLVLAALALEPGAPVPVSRLVELVWGDDPPRTAERTLQSYVARLRRGLGPGSIVRTGTAYRLDVGPDEVDVGRFERLLAAGDAAGALAEWAGEPLAGLEAPGFTPVVDRLTEGWLAARELDLASRLERDPASALAPLTELTARHPFREGLWALLMTALYRVGRQADALAAYGRARHVLVEELGVEPGPRLRALEAQVLGHDPRLATATAGDDGPGGAPRPDRGGGRSPSPGPTPAGARLIGRERLLQEVATALGDHRLVTLTGPGGVGKTSLATAAARREATAGCDARFVDLSVVSAGPDVPRAALDALGPVGAPALGLPTAVAAAVGEGPTVVVLDNCEHVIAGVAELASAVLDSCPGARLLATSREPLGLVEERVVVVPTLDPEGAGADLFVARATAASASFDAHAARPDVVELCRRLDGVPLAIELAAARSRSLAPGDLLERLDGGQGLLAAAGPSRPARHRSLRAAVEWSYDLLAEDERTVFQRLAVFPADFELGAAEAVAADDQLGPLEVDDLLDRLVRQSMVNVVTGDGRIRFRLLAAMRLLAAEHLAAEGHAAAVEARHTRWCLGRVGEIGRQLAGHDERRAVERLRRLWPDLRAAVDRACAAGDAGLARDLIEPVAAESFLRSRDEIGDWSERLLGLARHDDEDLLTFGLMWVARRHLRHRDQDGYAELTSRYGAPSNPLARHAAALVVEDHERLADLCPEASALLRRRGQPYLADLHEVGLARALLALGRFAEHDQVAAGLVERFRATGPPTFLHWALGMLGYSKARQGRADEADALFAASADVEVPVGTHSRRAPVAARAAARAGEVAEAFRILRDHADELLERRDLYEARLVGIDVVGHLTRAGRLADATRLLGYLDTTGLLAAPAFAALVAGPATQLEREVAGHEEVRAEGRRLDDRAALALMRDLADELARPAPVPGTP